MGETQPQRWEHRSWRGKETPRPSNAECSETCRANAADASAAYERSKAAYDALPPGDPRLEQVVQDLARHRSDVRHWNELAGWYDEQPEPAVATERRPPVAAAPPRSRVVGEDDGDEDEPVTAWSDVGYR